MEQFILLKENYLLIFKTLVSKIALKFGILLTNSSNCTSQTDTRIKLSNWKYVTKRNYNCKDTFAA